MAKALNYPEQFSYNGQFEKLGGRFMVKQGYITPSKENHKLTYSILLSYPRQPRY
jgi:hypothetical protein